jgi:hypothetical protein
MSIQDAIKHCTEKPSIYFDLFAAIDPRSFAVIIKPFIDFPGQTSNAKMPGTIFSAPRRFLSRGRVGPWLLGQSRALTPLGGAAARSQTISTR